MLNLIELEKQIKKLFSDKSIPYAMIEVVDKISEFAASDLMPENKVTLIHYVANIAKDAFKERLEWERKYK